MYGGNYGTNNYGASYGTNSYGAYGGMNGFREPSMWWKPSNDKERSIFESYKTDVKTFLTICKEGVPVRAAYNQMAEQMEAEIRYQDLGFKNFGEFLFHCQDVLEVRTDLANGYYLFFKGIADEETEHLRRLVEGQAKAKTRSNKFCARLGNTRHCSAGVLLQILTRPNHLMPPPSTRPSNYPGRGGRGGYRGSRPNRGRTGSFRPPRLSSFDTGSNGVPALKPYQPDNIVKPGLYKSVMDQLAPDLESSDDDMDDWYWGSAADAKKSSDGLHSDGEDVVDSDVNRTGFKTPEEIKSPTQKSIEQFTMSEYSAVSQATEPKSANLKLLEVKPLAPKPMEPTLLKPQVTIIPKPLMNHQISYSVPPKRLNPFTTKTVNNLGGSAGTTVPKLVPYVNKTESSSISSSISAVLPPEPKAVINKSTAQAQAKPAIPKLVPYVRGPVKVVDTQEVARETTGNETLKKSTMEDIKETAKESEKPKAVTSTTITNPPKVSLQSPSIPAETQKQDEVSSKELVAVMKLTELKKTEATTSASPTLPEVVIVNPFSGKFHNSSLATTARTVKIDTSNKHSTVEEILSRRMNIPKDKAFKAKLAGADGFGFLFIQLDEYNINKCFDKLQEDLDNFYFQEGVRNALRIPQDQFKRGLLVAARVGNHFCRARIFDFEKDGVCFVVDLEDHEFAEVSFEDVYQLDPNFARPLPRAIMCKLADISDDHMMTDEFANAFEETPLYPPNVLVKFVKVNNFYGVPEVSMTLESTGKDVATLIKFYGGGHLKSIISDENRRVRQHAQKKLRDDLVQIKYVVL